jgi:hypothetical protein
MESGCIGNNLRPQPDAALNSIKTLVLEKRTLLGREGIVTEAVSPTVAVKLEAIQSLAEVAHNALPLGLNSIYLTSDGLLAISRPPREARLRFSVDGLLFNVAVSPTETDSVCQMWAEIGYVPYTVESPVRRRQTLTVLRNATGLPHARFVIDNDQKILLVAELTTPGHLKPEDLIYELGLVLQEARPYLRLLAQTLYQS